MLSAVVSSFKNKNNGRKKIVDSKKDKRNVTYVRKANVDAKRISIPQWKIAQKKRKLVEKAHTAGMTF